MLRRQPRSPLFPYTTLFRSASSCPKSSCDASANRNPQPETRMHAEVVVLRLIHILGGIVWVGGMTVMAVFIMPVLGGLGAAAGPVMTGINQKKFPVVMPIVALLTILSGLRLLMIDSASFQGAYFQSPV